jgi:hypothetical protein
MASCGEAFPLLVVRFVIVVPPVLIRFDTQSIRGFDPFWTSDYPE